MRSLTAKKKQTNRAPEEAIEGTFRYQMDRIEDFNTNPRPGLVLQSANALFSVDAPFSRAYVTKVKPTLLVYRSHKINGRSISLNPLFLCWCL